MHDESAEKLADIARKYKGRVRRIPWFVLASLGVLVLGLVNIIPSLSGLFLAISALAIPASVILTVLFWLIATFRINVYVHKSYNLKELRGMKTNKNDAILAMIEKDPTLPDRVFEESIKIERRTNPFVHIKLKS